MNLYLQTKSVFNAFKDAKAAYHARKTQILAERNLERERREAVKLAALEKEARRADRQKRRLEHEKRKAERKELEASGVKAIEWKDGDKKEKKSKDKKEKEKDKDRDAKKDRKKDKSDDGVLVVYDGDKKHKEKKERKHHSSKDKESSKDKDKKRKGSASDGDSKALVVVPAAPLTPAIEDDFDFPSDDQADNNQLRLPYEASVMSIAPALLQNVPGGSQAQQLLGIGQQMISMMDPDGDSPLTALLVRLTDILDTFDCLNASITTLVASLQKDPDALAMVGLTLAEISAVVAKTAPGVVVAAKAAFPIIFSLLASPQFLVTAGASVIFIGGYQIIRKVTGIGAAAPPTPKAIEDEDHLAFGPGMDDIHSEPEELGKLPPPAAKTLPQASAAPSPDFKKDKKKAMTFPPSPPLTPAVETKKELGNSSGTEAKKDEVKERPKMVREGSKRQAIRSFLTRSHTVA